MVWILPKLSNYQQVAPSVRTGGSRHTGLAAPPHRNIQWSEALRDRYFDIASKCDKETLLQQRYTPDCMHKRNRYMVDQADYIIAVWNGKPSGTGKTVQYAQQQGKPVRVINPITLVVENI